MSFSKMLTQLRPRAGAFGDVVKCETARFFQCSNGRMIETRSTITQI